MVFVCKNKIVIKKIHEAETETERQREAVSVFERRFACLVSQTDGKSFQSVNTSPSGNLRRE